MRKSKLLSTILLVILSFLLLTGCSNDSDKKKYCYHALLTGKEQHGYNKILNLNTLSDIICSLNDLKDYMQAISAEKNRAICLDPAVAFFEVKALDQKEFPEQKHF